MSFDPEVHLAALQSRASRARALHGAGYRGLLFRVVGIVLVIIRDLAFGQLTLRAMSLVYTTLLSIVPLLALSFSVLKAFGVHNQIEPTLQRFLEPLGERGEQIAAQIVQFISNMNVGVLGSVGLALLLYTSVSLIQKIEMSFNYIWHVAEPRPIGTRFSSYLSVLLVGPLLAFSALGITAAASSTGIVQALLSIEPLGLIAVQIGKLVPYALIVGLFTFIYLYIPNTRVHLAAAAGGALVGGVAWQTAGWAFAAFVANSAQYAAIYSGFAILILFMIWVYVSWLIVLVGCSVSFYLQHGEYVMASPGEPPLSGRVRERLALAVIAAIAGRHLAGGAPLTSDSLAQMLRMPSYAVRDTIEVLEHCGLLVATRADPCSWVPARDPATITPWDVVAAVRASGERDAIGVERLPLPGPLERLVRRQEAAASAELETGSLRDLIETEPERAGLADAGPEQAGPEQAGPEQAGPEQARPEQARPEQARPEQARPEQVGPRPVGPEQAEPVRPVATAPANR
ncbi:MAG: YhjD/YihY/BrkB family envelope integrity protein [Lautropia sp.]